MNNKIITLQTELNVAHAKNLKIRLATRILGWSLCIIPAAVMGFIIGGIFGMSFAIAAGFLLAQIVDSIFTKKLWKIN